MYVGKQNRSLKKLSIMKRGRSSTQIPRCSAKTKIHREKIVIYFLVQNLVYFNLINVYIVYFMHFELANKIKYYI